MNRFAQMLKSLPGNEENSNNSAFFVNELENVLCETAVISVFADFSLLYGKLVGKLAHIRRKTQIHSEKSF